MMKQKFLISFILEVEPAKPIATHNVEAWLGANLKNAWPNVKLTDVDIEEEVASTPEELANALLDIDVIKRLSTEDRNKLIAALKSRLDKRDRPADTDVC